MLANSQFAMFITTERSFMKNKDYFQIIGGSKKDFYYFQRNSMSFLCLLPIILYHFSSFIGVNCNSWQVARYNLLLRLFVSDNYISDIEQFDLKSLSSSLKTLILAGNSLTSVPEGRAHLRKLNIASPLLKNSTQQVR